MGCWSRHCRVCWDLAGEADRLVKMAHFRDTADVHRHKPSRRPCKDAPTCPERRMTVDRKHALAIATGILSLLDCSPSLRPSTTELCKTLFACSDVPSIVACVANSGQYSGLDPIGNVKHGQTYTASLSISLVVPLSYLWSVSLSPSFCGEASLRRSTRRGE